MTRDLDATFLTQMVAGSVQLVYFVEIEFNSGTIRFWSGLGDIIWNSETWTGAGNLIGIQPARELTSVSSAGVMISLDGVDPAILSLALLDVRQNKPVSCWFGFMTTAGTIVGGDSGPYLFFGGKVDVMNVSPGADSAVITLNAESDLISLKRSRIRRYTHQDQIIDFTSDLGFEYIDSVSLWIGDWGSQITEDIVLDPPPFVSERPEEPGEDGFWDDQGNIDPSVEFGEGGDTETGSPEILENEGQ